MVKDGERLMEPCRPRFQFACLLAVFAAVFAFGSLAVWPALSQERGDPIGAITKAATFDRAQRVDVGKTKAGRTVCYFREEGTSHSLDIGIAAGGAFIRLETGDSRETTPSPPLRVFAGKQKTRRDGANEYATNDFEVLQEYGGGIDFYVPKPDTGDFVVVAKGDAKTFLDMVARARTEFVVVQSAADEKNTDIVAIYKFTTAKIPALLSCARDRIR